MKPDALDAAAAEEREAVLVLWHVWKPALDAAGVPATRANGMHALRHTYASVLLEDGVSIKALAEYLGHADPGFTLRTYTQLMPSSKDRAGRRSIGPSPQEAPLKDARMSARGGR